MRSTSGRGEGNRSMDNWRGDMWGRLNDCVGGGGGGGEGRDLYHGRLYGDRHRDRLNER